MDGLTQAMSPTHLQSMEQERHQKQHGMNQKTPRADMELIYRIAQLETELRMVKEQLVQAQQSTQYLLQLMSGTTSARSVQPTSGHEPQLQHAPKQIVARKDSVLAAFSKTTLDSKLVNFGDDEESLLDNDVAESSIDTPSLTPDVHLIEHKQVEDSIGLGISHSISPDSSFALSTNNPTSSSSFSGGNQPGFSIRQSNGTSVFIPTPTIGLNAGSSFSSPASSEPMPFTGREHRTLAGKAFVWVDMSPEELTEVIARYAKENPRHTAEQYRAYFEDVVRPTYLQQQREKEAARAAAFEGRGPQTQGFKADAQDQLTRRDQVDEDEKRTVTVPQLDNDDDFEQLPARDKDCIDVLESAAEAVAAEVIESPTEILSEGLRLSMHAHSNFTSPSHPEVIREAPAATAHGNGVLADEDRVPFIKADSLADSIFAVVPAYQLAGLEAQEEGGQDVSENTATAGYQPPRLYNPNALNDAKLLQAEFQNVNAGRDRRGRQLPSTERDSGPPSVGYHGRHRESQPPHRRDSKAPGNFDRAQRAPTSYITYPYEVSELFATLVEGDLHPFRTVLISDIPPTTTLFEVLNTVRGGTIFSSILLDTAGMHTHPPLTTNTAMITFTHGRQARDFINRSSSTFPTKLLPTVSRPIPARVHADIRHHNLSRILFLHDPDTDTNAKRIWTPPEIALQLTRTGVRYPLKAEADPQVPGLVLFHFASMAEAKTAWNVVRRDYTFFGDVDCGFFADPCGRPVESGDGEEGGDAVEVPVNVDVDVDVDVGDGSGEYDEDVVKTEQKSLQPKVSYHRGIHSEHTSRAVMFEG